MPGEGFDEGAGLQVVEADRPVEAGAEACGPPHRGHWIAAARKSPLRSVPSSANVLRARFDASEAKAKPSSDPEKVPRARAWRKKRPVKAGASAARRRRPRRPFQVIWKATVAGTASPSRTVMSCAS